MANTGNSDKWYFTKEQLETTPSRQCGYDSYKELSCRQQAANFIQDLGQKLRVSQLCINTAIVYMHRFYVFHSFTHFAWQQMAAAALFLAAKVEEQPRKLEYVIRYANICINAKDTTFDINSERYIAQSQDLVFNENVLLQTLGFDVAIDHPHTHVVRCCHLVRASKDLAQTSYFMASNSLHLTTMCIQYKPTVVACFCILLACKWTNWEIPLSNEKKEWYTYVDTTITAELLQQLTEEFLVIFENCPSRLKEKIMAIADNVAHTPSLHIASPFDNTDMKKIVREDGKDHHPHRSHESKSVESDAHKHRPRPHEASSSQQQKEREYREKKERERLAQQHSGQKAISSSNKPISHGHHRPPLDPKMKQHSRPPSTSSSAAPSYTTTANRAEQRDLLRKAATGATSRSEHATAKDPTSQSKTRDFLIKPSAVETNNYGDARLGYSDKQRVEAGRSRSGGDLNKVMPPVKHEPSGKTYAENNLKKHSVNTGHDKSSAYLNKSSNSTSQKVKSPQHSDASKSVPKPANFTATSKHNGSNGSSYNLPSLDGDVKATKTEVPVKDEVAATPVMKRPSLFSPEKSPLKNSFLKTTTTPDKRNRNYSSGSEPELRPVIKKIDQVEGFENLMRDSTIGINKFHQVPDIITPIADKKLNAPNYAKEMKPPDIIPPLSSDASLPVPLYNGIETNPVLISSLLKEAPAVTNLPSIVASSEQSESKEYHHHKSKKKNKEKHKHKDKDKSRDDKEKKKKHKDKDKHKHKEGSVGEPIKIKIHKDKIQEASIESVPTSTLKIKIPKDKIKAESIGESSSSSSQPSIGLKIKIPKDVINNCTDGGSSSKKRDRSGSGGAGEPPNKVSKSYKESKPNGRHPYKVAHMGDGDTSLHRLAESKYINKGTSS